MASAPDVAPVADLLVAVAGISGTLVEIVGGFLASRVVTIAADRAAAQRELVEAEDRESRAEHAVAEHDELVYAVDFEEAEHHLRSLLVGTRGEIDGPTLMQHLAEEELEQTVSHERLVEYLQKVADNVRRAFELLHGWDRDGGWPNDERTARHALQAHDVDLSPELARSIFWTVEESRGRRIEGAKAERARAAEQSAEPGSLQATIAALGRSMGKGFPNLVPTVSTDDIIGLHPGVLFQYPRGGDRLREEFNDARAEVRLLRRSLQHAAVPPDLRRGLYVLAGFALVGIVYPLILLANGAVHLGPWWRTSVVALFTGGLVAVFWYLVVTVHDSTKHNGDGGV